MADGLGSVRNLLDSSQTTRNIYDTYAFGDSLGSQTQGVMNPYRLTSREYEAGGISSQHFYRNRYYIPCKSLSSACYSPRALLTSGRENVLCRQ